MKCVICFEGATGIKPNDYLVRSRNGHVFHYCCVVQMIASGPSTCPICDEELAFDPFHRVDGNQIQPTVHCTNSTSQSQLLNSLPSQSENNDPWLLGNRRSHVSSSIQPASYTVQPDCTFKLVVLGDMNVGKSSLLQRYADDKYDPMIPATAGCDLRVKVIQIGGKNVRLNLWDTAGQERHRAIVDVYLRRADGIIFCFDITDSATFFSLQDWYQFAKRCVPDDIIKVIVGCKSDLWSQRVVRSAQVTNVAELWNAQYIYASAKDDTNVEIVFRTLAAIILEKHLLTTSTLPSAPLATQTGNQESDIVKLEFKETTKRGKKRSKWSRDCCDT